MRSALKVLFAPIMLLGFNGVAVWMDMAGLSLYWLIPLVIAVILFATAVERIIPYQPAWNEGPDEFARDLVHAVVNMAIIIFLILVIRPGHGLWPEAWPVWAQLLLAIVIVDAGLSFAHYASHRVDFLWKLHAAHHSPTRMYGFNGLLQHPFHQAFEIICGGAPVIILGMPHEIGLLVGFAVVVQFLLQHSNADMQLGPLNWLLALAPVHRRHHTREYEGYGVNFGFFTNLWDYVLRTGDFGKRPRIGETDLGINDLSHPKAYVAQFRYPFARENALSSQPARETAP